MGRYDVFISHAHATGGAAESFLYRRQIEAGKALGRAFLPGPVAAALRAALGDAERYGVPLELGSRSPTSAWPICRGSYHQIGMVAQDRGSYHEALDWYRKALRINEELGNRVGMATSLSQMGVLFTERGAPEEAVPLSLRSLALRLELRVPNGINLHWLGRQRADLGEDRFRELVAKSVGEESLESVLGMLDQYAASQADATASGAKGKPE